MCPPMMVMVFWAVDIKKTVIGKACTYIYCEITAKYTANVKTNPNTSIISNVYI
jgi:hypothetical protein